MMTVHFDRRAWLRVFGLALGGLGASRLVRAQSSNAAASPSTHPLTARLSLNENPYGPAPSVVTALQREFANLCRYTGAEYDTLVDAIAAREGVSRDHIVLGEILEPLGTHLSLQGGPDWPS